VSTGSLGKPNNTGSVTSEFGPRVHPIKGIVKNHSGIDIGVPTGADVLAVDGGIVDYVGPFGGYGNIVIIRHENGLASLYAHNSTLEVAVNQKVTKGQRIAGAGSTGDSTGPHIHLEVIEGYQAGQIRSGQAVDPRNYINF
jgi:murein DD-endopeptidase MepM/ murein hydrolase activator NlpD